VNKQNILYWLFAVAAIIFEVIVTGYGISLFIRGQNCKSYADLGCAFGAMLSLIFIPYGLINFLFVGITSLPFKLARLIGGILSTLSAIVLLWLFCLLTLWIISNSTTTANSEMMGLSFPFFLFLGGASMLGVGVIGFLRFRQQQ
jgi:hypothetical protein